MSKNESRYRLSVAGRLFFCLLLLVLFSVSWIRTGAGEETVPALNASGNLNRPLSVDPIGESEGYSAVLYDNRNGLPTSEANAIAQTGEGFLWIGSYAGLIRYDGNTFEIIESSDGILNTRCLYVDSRDRLWIGTNDFGVFLMEKGKPQRVDQPDQLASLSIRSMAEDTKGLIYIGSAAGIATVDDKLNLTVLDDNRVSGKTITCLRLGPDGLVYGLTYDGDIFSLKDGAILDFLPRKQYAIETVFALLPDPLRPGMLYLASSNPETRKARVYHCAPDDDFTTAEAWEISDLYNVETMEYIDGKIWLCAGTGIGVLDAEGVHLLTNTPMDKLVGHVMTDHEGNLWFTSTRQCVMKIVPNRFLDLFARAGLSEEIVNTTCMDGERLFVGTDSGLIVIENGQKLDRLPLSGAVMASGKDLGVDDLLAFLKGVRIRSISRDSQGRLWICTWNQYALLRYDHGQVTVFTRSDGAPEGSPSDGPGIALLSDQARTVAECADGSMIVAHPEGVSVVRGDRVTATYGAEAGLVVTSVLTVTEGFHHELILGSDGGGIYIMDQNGTRHIGLKEGLKSEVILRIKRSRFRDLYWIATGNSLAFMTPDYKVTTVEHFPYSNNLDFYENSRGDLWVLTSNGIYVVSAEKMLENGPIDAVYFGIPSGLPFIATSNSFSELTEEGDLYIAGVKGAIRVNIEKPFDRLSEIKVAMPFLDIDGKLIYPDASGSFSVPHYVRKVTIHPYIFNYALIDPEVSYQLNGFDAGETTVRRSELQPVSYTNLHEGTYSFDIRVKDPIGDDNVSASFRIVKENAMSPGTAGSIIIDAVSLFFMGGILVYTARYRKRGRLDDRLFFIMVVTNLVLALSDGIAYLLEGNPASAARYLIITANILFYAAFALFPFLYMLYLDFRAFEDKARIRKIKLVAFVPCLIQVVLLVVNLFTGWIFTVSEDTIYHPGPLNDLMFIPAILYVLVSLYLVTKINVRLVFLGILIILTRIAWGIWFRDISSTAFTYTMFLVCTHIHVMNRPLYEENL